MLLLASCSFLRTLFSASSNLLNSVFTAPSTVHTSLEPFNRVSEAHLQTAEHRRERGRTADDHTVLALQAFRETRPAQDLGVEALGREEEDPEIGRVRRVDVLLLDLARLVAHLFFERLRSELDRLGIGALGRVDEALVVLLGELGVDRQPDLALAGVAAGELDRELDALGAVRIGRDVATELVWSQHLLEQIAQLHFTPAAARRYCSRPSSNRRRPWRGFASPRPLCLLESFTDQFERFTKALLERGVQLLVDGGAHLFEFFRIVPLKLASLRSTVPRMVSSFSLVVDESALKFEANSSSCCFCKAPARSCG